MKELDKLIVTSNNEDNSIRTKMHIDWRRKRKNNN